MLIFTLAISCLTASNLPWFMNLIFQVPMQYCSLHHWSLLSPPGTSTTRCHFCFGSASSFFSGAICLLFPSSILDTFQTGGLIFWCRIFLPFHTVHGVLSVRILERFAIPSSSGPRFVRTLHCDLSTLGGPAWHGSQLHCYATFFSTTRQWSMKGFQSWRGCNPMCLDIKGATVSFKTF